MQIRVNEKCNQFNRNSRDNPVNVNMIHQVNYKNTTKYTDRLVLVNHLTNLSKGKFTTKEVVNELGRINSKNRNSYKDRLALNPSGVA